METRIVFISEGARRELLSLARSTLECYLSTGRVPEHAPTDPALHLRCGAFVSLHRREELRGCIGRMISDQELYRTVQRCAISAACEDPRFPRVEEDELPDLTIEISVLSPCRRIQDTNSVEVGKHGLLISQGPYRGVLLPQVATEHHWDRENFLAHTCRKAGLSADAWRDPSTTIEVFSAEVFSEKQHFSPLG